MLLKNLIKNSPKDIKNLNIKGLALNSKEIKKDFIFLQLKEINLIVKIILVNQSKKVPALFFVQKVVNLKATNQNFLRLIK